MIDSVCDGRQPRYISYGKVWTTAEWRTVTEGVSEILKSFVRKAMNKNEV